MHEQLLSVAILLRLTGRGSSLRRDTISTPEKSMKLFSRAFILLLVTLASAHAQDIHAGDALLRSMRDRYQPSWYQTITFPQKSTTYKPDGSSNAETWYEAAMLPGKLRIDIGPPESGNGYVLGAPRGTHGTRPDWRTSCL